MELTPTIKSENVLNKIKNGEFISNPELAAINTPVLPESVFDIEKSSNGVEFKRTINTDRLIEWLNASAQAKEIDKAFIKGTTAHANLTHGLQTIDAKLEVNDGVARTGLIWFEAGKAYPVSLVGTENIEAMKQALQLCRQNAFTPNTTNQFESVSTEVEFDKINF